MTLDSVLSAGRAAAERRMTSTCTIRRPAAPTDPPATDANGFEVPGWDVVAAGLPCRVGGPPGSDAPSRTVTVGNVDVQVATRVLHLPAETTGLVDGDYVEVTAGDTAGHAFRIADATPADQTTAVRVQILEVQRPAGWS